MHHSFKLVSSSRLQDIPHSLEVDEKGVHINLGRVLVAEVGGEMDDAIHTFQSPVDGVEVGYVPVEFFSLPFPVESAVRRPSFGAVIEGAHLVATGEAFQHGPADPPSGTHNGHFHKHSS